MCVLLACSVSAYGLRITVFASPVPLNVSLPELAVYRSLHVQLLERVHGLVPDRSVGGFLQSQVEPLGRRIPRFMIQFSCFKGVRCGFADGAAHPLIPDSLISCVFS